MLSPKNLERTIKIYRDCKTQDDIIKELVKAYNGKVTTSQANYVSDLRLRQLTVNEREKTEEELHVLDGEIKKIRSIVDDIDNIKEVIINEIKDIKNEYGYPRKSRIINLDGDNNNTNVKIVQLMLDGSFIFSETETPEHLASDVTPISGDEVCLIDDKGYFIKVDTNKIDTGKPMTMTSIGKNIMGKCIAAVSNKSNDIIMLSNKKFCLFFLKG
jgi:DNA gyrase/topoisomerase IV subunit A